MQHALDVVEEPEPPGPDHHAGRQVPQDRTQFEAPEQRHRDDGGREEHGDLAGEAHGRVAKTCSRCGSSVDRPGHDRRRVQQLGCDDCAIAARNREITDRRVRQVGDDDQPSTFSCAFPGDHVLAPGLDRAEAAARQRRFRLPQPDQPSIVVEQRRRVGVLHGDVASRVPRLQRLPRAVGLREAAMRGRTPRHRVADHLVGLLADLADFLAVVDEGHARRRQQQARRELEPRRVLAELARDPVLVVVRDHRRVAVGRVARRDVVERVGELRLGAGPRGVEDRRREVELEGEIERILGDVVTDGFGAGPDLADRQHVRLDLPQPGLEALQPRARLRRVGHHVAVLDQVADRVEPEAVHVHLAQPELGDAFRLGGHGRVAIIEVGHAGPEDAEIVLPLLFLPDLLAPGTERRGHCVGRHEDVPVARRRSRRAAPARSADARTTSD